MITRVWSGTGLDLTLDERLGVGKEGVVFTVREHTQVAIKVYLEPGRHVDRVRAMVRTWRPSAWSDQGVHLAWPLDTVAGDDGAVVGFAMERLDPQVYVPIGRVLNPSTRRVIFPGFTWKSQFQVAYSLAASLARLHRNEVVVGDLSEGNVWVTRDGNVAFLDCDSMQFREVGSGVLFPCLHFTDEVAPPELLDGQDNPGEPRRPHSDNFTLAVIVCQLLMEGAHPFRGIPRQGNSTHRTDNLLNGDSWLLNPERMKAPPQWPRHPSDLALPPRVLSLAEQCFGPGHRAPEQRPTASTWAEALALAMEELRTCAVDRSHVFHRDAECPWCRRDGRSAHAATITEPSWQATRNVKTRSGPTVQLHDPQSPPAVTRVSPALVVLAIVIFIIILAFLFL